MIPIKIYPETPYLHIDWQLSNKCNYKCSYCNFDSNGGTLDWIDINIAKKLVDKITKRSLNTNKHKFRVFTLLGGEPTLWKNLIDLCKHIKEYDNNYIVILTNGFRSIKWWKENKQFLDRVMISYHNQFANIDHIINVANTIDDTCQTGVQILVDQSNFNTCQLAFYKCLNELNYVEVTAKKGETFLGSGKWMRYSKEQTDWMKASAHMTSQFRSFKRFKNTRKYNIDNRTTLVEYIDSTVLPVSPRYITINDQNKFKGWACNIGIDLVAITPNGSILPASGGCNPHLQIGNYLDMPFEDFKWPNKPTICTYKRCNCLTDVAVSKYKL